eukprot:261491-Alexandrium_andersonii.AAC.1
MLIRPASNRQSTRTARIPRGPARSQARTTGGPRFGGLADGVLEGVEALAEVGLLLLAAGVGAHAVVGAQQ